MKQPLLAIVALFIALAQPSGSSAQRDFRPVDQAAQQPDFFTFRAQLLQALANRDVDAVLSAVHKDIKNSFGGDGGLKEFMEMWRLESEDSELWATLTTVLALGGSFSSETSFSAPYVFSQWPHDLNGFEHMAVIAGAVRVRALPSSSASVIGSLSHSIVELGEVKDWEAQWIPVRLPGGKPGFVDRRFLRSPIDYRAIFEKLEGRWQMTILIAGD